MNPERLSKTPRRPRRAAAVLPKRAADAPAIPPPRKPLPPTWQRAA